MDGYIKLSEVMAILQKNKAEDMYCQYAYEAHVKDIKDIQKYVDDCEDRKESGLIDD